MVRIPAEYQEVEYLESTGTQWINTGIPLSRIIDINVNWTLRFSLTVIRTQILGGTNSYNKQIVVIQSRVRRDWVSTSNYGSFSPVLSTDAIYEISQRDGYYELTDKNGNVESKEITLYSSNSYPFILFAKSMNAEGTAVETSTISYMKLYSFRIFGDAEIANFIPCYRKSDNEPGMYDTVSGTFYTNSGTGTFLVGNDVSWDTASLLERRRQILLNTPHVETVSGAVASFNTDISANLKECKVYFSPVQEGTGDPSPDNVRPITGWDGVTVYLSSSDTSNPTTLTIPFNRTIYGGYVDLVRGEVVEEWCNFTLDGTNYVMGSANASVNAKNIARAYSYAAEFTQKGLPIFKAHGARYCNKLPTINTVAVNNIDYNCLQYYNTASTNNRNEYISIMIDKDELADTSSNVKIAESINEWLSNNPLQVLYDIAEPISYSLTPETIKALKGINNIWSNANGNIEVSYYSH